MVEGTIRIIMAFCCAVWLVVSAQPAGAEGRVALVIGNSKYAGTLGELRNPANDARLIAKTLEKLGFKVDLVLNADQKTMKRAVKSFGARLLDAGHGTIGLFYYAGHGVQVAGENYLIPVNAEIASEGDVSIEAVAANDVLAQMQFAGNAVNLIFLDACRNNPIARGTRSAEVGLARVDAPRGSFVGYSTAPGEVAADGAGANSPYALALAEQLVKPGVSIEVAHRRVRSEVLKLTNDAQTPWDSSSLTGEIVLAGLSPEITASPGGGAQLAAPAPDKETVFWESIQNSGNAADFTAYLEHYPNGSFADLAKNKLAELKSKGTPQDASSLPRTNAPSGAAAPDGEADLTQDQRRQIEIALLNEKANPGAIDGVFDSDARAAIKAWQYNAGVAPTGHLDRTQISKLISLDDDANPEGQYAEFLTSSTVADPRLKRAAATLRGRPVTYVVFEGHLYIAVLDDVLFQAAEERAKEAGGHLATVASNDENNAIFALVKDDHRFWDESDDGFMSGVLLGLYQKAGAKSSSEGWAWTDGASADFRKWSKTTEQPNEIRKGAGPGAAAFGGLSDFKPTPEWNDVGLFRQMTPGYVIEIE